MAEFINLHSFTKQVLRLLLVSWVIATAIVVTTGTNIMKILLTMIVNSTVFVIIRFSICLYYSGTSGSLLHTTFERQLLQDFPHSRCLGHIWLQRWGFKCLRMNPWAPSMALKPGILIYLIYIYIYIYIPYLYPFKVPYKG